MPGLFASRRARGTGAGFAVSLAVLLAGCAGPEPQPQPAQPAAPSGPLTIYSGRSEALVGPLLEELEAAVGTDVEVRYGSTGEMSAQLLEEGQGSPADVFFGQDAGALGALAAAGMLAPLSADVVAPLPEPYRATDSTWVATSARARVVAYSPERVTEAELPRSVDDLLAPRWTGRLGYAPSNASWQSFVTGLRLVRGEDSARQWLQAFAAQQPQRFDGNAPILDAVAAGTIDAGLVNHYYLFQKTKEVDPATYPVRNHFVPNDPLGLINVAGAGVVAATDNSEAAQRAVAFLLSPRAQQFFVDETGEYPVIDGVRPTGGYELASLSSLAPPDVNLADLASVEQTEAMLQEVGLL